MEQYGHTTTCPKCGSKEQAVRFVPAWRSPGGSVIYEHLMISCKLCGYSWDEKCLDDQSAK